MFASLKRPFRRDRTPGPERVAALPRIRALLRQLEAERELLCVSVPGCDQSANTAVMGVRDRQGTFYLDELNADATHRALLQHRRLEVSCRLQGTELAFVTSLLGVTEDDGLALYEMALPRQILRVQRRENFRLKLGPGLVVPISIPGFEGDTVKGEVFDLSATGIGAYLYTRHIPAAGKVLTGVTLTLPRSRPLKASIEIRFARQNAAQHMLRIGARFVSLAPDQERQIARFLAEQQRKRRRHAPR